MVGIIYLASMFAPSNFASLSISMFRVSASIVEFLYVVELKFCFCELTPKSTSPAFEPYSPTLRSKDELEELLFALCCEASMFKLFAYISSLSPATMSLPFMFMSLLDLSSALSPA